MTREQIRANSINMIVVVVVVGGGGGGGVVVVVEFSFLKNNYC